MNEVIKKESVKELQFADMQSIVGSARRVSHLYSVPFVDVHNVRMGDILYDLQSYADHVYTETDVREGLFRFEQYIYNSFSKFKKHHILDDEITEQYQPRVEDWLRKYKKVDTVRDEEDFIHQMDRYIFRIMPIMSRVNNFREIQATDRIRMVHHDDFDDGGDDDFIFPDESMTPEQIVEQRESLNEISQVVDSLSASQKKALVAWIEDGAPPDDDVIGPEIKALVQKGQNDFQSLPTSEDSGSVGIPSANSLRQRFAEVSKQLTIRQIFNLLSELQPHQSFAILYCMGYVYSETKKPEFFARLHLNRWQLHGDFNKGVQAYAERLGSTKVIPDDPVNIKGYVSAIEADFEISRFNYYARHQPLRLELEQLTPEETKKLFGSLTDLERSFVRMMFEKDEHNRYAYEYISQIKKQLPDSTQTTYILRKIRGLLSNRIQIFCDTNGNRIRNNSAHHYLLHRKSTVTKFDLANLTQDSWKLFQLLTTADSTGRYANLDTLQSQGLLRSNHRSNIDNLRHYLEQKPDFVVSVYEGAKKLLEKRSSLSARELLFCNNLISRIDQGLSVRKQMRPLAKTNGLSREGLELLLRKMDINAIYTGGKT
ncbi:MAG TPA: hypothetical protein VMR81_04290 [Patescibacteria group bacterium]|nr:hypothetical protein [Patescibacteria group bacterium]